MPATTDQPLKTQPWKAHWSPVDKEKMTANQNYLVDDAGSLLIDGCCAGNLFAELACARKETGAPKAQPWKSHWSAADKDSASANQQYLVDEDGTLLIDGAHNCANGDLFFELASANKETEAPKAQPWKAHWSAAENEAGNINQNYMTDDAGALLIDGCQSAATFSELACARNEKEKM